MQSVPQQAGTGMGNQSKVHVSLKDRSFSSHVHAHTDAHTHEDPELLTNDFLPSAPKPNTGKLKSIFYIFFAQHVTSL